MRQAFDDQDCFLEEFSINDILSSNSSCCSPPTFPVADDSSSSTTPPASSKMSRKAESETSESNSSKKQNKALFEQDENLLASLATDSDKEESKEEEEDGLTNNDNFEFLSDKWDDLFSSPPQQQQILPPSPIVVNGANQNSTFDHDHCSTPSGVVQQSPQHFDMLETAVPQQEAILIPSATAASVTNSSSSRREEQFINSDYLYGIIDHELQGTEPDIGLRWSMLDFNRTESNVCSSTSALSNYNNSVLSSTTSISPIPTTLVTDSFHHHNTISTTPSTRIVQQQQQQFDPSQYFNYPMAFPHVLGQVSPFHHHYLNNQPNGFPFHHHQYPPGIVTPHTDYPVETTDGSGVMMDNSTATNSTTIVQPQPQPQPQQDEHEKITVTYLTQQEPAAVAGMYRQQQLQSYNLQGYPMLPQNVNAQLATTPFIQPFPPVLGQVSPFHHHQYLNSQPNGFPFHHHQYPPGFVTPHTDYPVETTDGSGSSISSGSVGSSSSGGKRKRVSGCSAKKKRVIAGSSSSSAGDAGDAVESSPKKSKTPEQAQLQSVREFEQRNTPLRLKQSDYTKRLTLLPSGTVIEVRYDINERECNNEQRETVFRPFQTQRSNLSITVDGHPTQFVATNFKHTSKRKGNKSGRGDNNKVLRSKNGMLKISHKNFNGITLAGIYSMEITVAIDINSSIRIQVEFHLKGGSRYMILYGMHVRRLD